MSQIEKTVAQPMLVTADRAEKKSRGRLTSGVFITFEGGEGVGKTTQLARLAQRMTALGLDVVAAREPGGTALGEYVRSWVKREGATPPLADTLMFEAARADLVLQVVNPALKQRKIVVLDRYTDSTLAYQGYGRGLDIEQITSLNDIATGGLRPDLTVLLDLDPKAAFDRLSRGVHGAEGNGATAASRADPENERRFERMPLDFHRRVLAGYRELAREGGRWCVIGADQAPHRVADAIWKRVRRLLLTHGVDVQQLEKDAVPASQPAAK